MHTNRKRKPAVLEKTNRADKKSNVGNLFSSQFLIDGSSPVQPNAQLLAHKPETAHQGPGRHRSVDIKGRILELIDEMYPPLVCPDCFHTSNGRVDADQHLKDKHHGKKLFSCLSPTCEQAYSSKAGLRYHLEHIHDVTLVESSANNISNRNIQKSAVVIKQPVDNNNNNTNRAKKLLSEKLQKKLDEIYPMNTCPACNEQFKKKTHVITHLVSNHHGEEPYKCIVDGCKRTKAYSTKEGLVYHLISYHDETE